jgi:hypothetical protein
MIFSHFAEASLESRKQLAVVRRNFIACVAFPFSVSIDTFLTLCFSIFLTGQSFYFQFFFLHFPTYSFFEVIFPNADGFLLQASIEIPNPGCPGVKLV